MPCAKGEKGDSGMLPEVSGIYSLGGGFREGPDPKEVVEAGNGEPAVEVGSQGLAGWNEAVNVIELRLS